ncbi:hypothetical protein PUN28_019614 [Cardiocondyla obscurior]|uniref:Uncharacterized protein n=1 Tax=Cardiocondyla obscurior TaxID=286306 RepID=A0AAW2EFF5_9HYME
MTFLLGGGNIAMSLATISTCVSTCVARCVARARRRRRNVEANMSSGEYPLSYQT